MKCKTIDYAARERIDFIEVDVPDPGPGEVQIKSLASGICAWDVHVFKNGVDWPTSPGHEGVGQVVKCGPGVSYLQEGDWVTGIGLGFTEYYNRPERELYRIPVTGDNRIPEKWIVEPVSCIVTGLDHCNLKAGDRIAVVGCGFMGQMFIQALGRSYVDRLIALDVNPSRLELARKFGATDAIDAREADIAALQQLAIDTVVDCSGNQKGLELASKIVRRGGRLNLFGWNHGTASFPGDIWHMNGLTVVNSAPNSAIRDPWPAAIRMLDRGIIDLKPLITHLVPLPEYPALLKQAAVGDPQYMKGVVRLAA
jgi:threonine dehydrogenase-like Zn-dependent dehydrogenase